MFKLHWGDNMKSCSVQVKQPHRVGYYLRLNPSMGTMIVRRSQRSQLWFTAGKSCLQIVSYHFTLPGLHSTWKFYLNENMFYLSVLKVGEFKKSTTWCDHSCTLSLTHIHMQGSVHRMSLFSHCSEWRMTCHRAKWENILVLIEKDKKGEMGNQEKRKQRIKKLVHYTRGVNHLMCRRSQNGILHSHVSMYEHDSQCLCLCCSNWSRSHTLKHSLTNTHSKHQNPAMRKAERLDQFRLWWLVLIEEKEPWEQRNIMTFSHSECSMR